MKKLIYLFVAGTILAFTACGGGETATEEAAPAVEEVAACADDCQKACCLGCKATEGDGVCLADHSCCAEHTEEATCCCGDENCDGSCHAAEESAEESHEGHDHE